LSEDVNSALVAPTFVEWTLAILTKLYIIGASPDFLESVVLCWCEKPFNLKLAHSWSVDSLS